MDKLMLSLDTGKHDIFLQRCITTKYGEKIHVKNISVLWKYKNILTNDNNLIKFITVPDHPATGVALSLQTQQIFHRLVQDTVAQDNPSKSISDMRKAIQDTNVVLNMAITPGIILIPSNMIILKNKVEGYNNVLRLATNAMKFGVNSKVNYVARTTKKPPIPPTEKPTKPIVTNDKKKRNVKPSPLPLGKYDRYRVLSHEICFVKIFITYIGL